MLNYTHITTSTATDTLSAPPMMNETALDITPVDSVQTYKRDIAPYDRSSSLTFEQRDAYKQALVEQVRAGNAQAREQLVTYLLSQVVRQAERYFYTYGWLHPMMELGDLIQAGNLVLLEKLDDALSRPDPCAYLLTYTHGAIHHVRFTDSLIPTPKSRSVQPCISSLDQPLSTDDERPLIEVLAAPSECSGGDERDFTDLYQAIDTLTEMQRRVILHRYGLRDMPAQERSEIDQELYGGRRLSWASERRALATLAGLLKSTYLGRDDHEIILSEPMNVPHDCQYRELKDEEIQRLDTACAALHARGEPLTSKRLRKEARIGSECTSAYLSQRGLRPHPSDRLERLRQAHATMQAQHASMTVHKLTRVAHVEQRLARTYLRQLGIVSEYHAQCSEEARQARLDQAYETLKTQHPEVTARSLRKAARVPHRVAASYLEERRAAEGLPPRMPYRTLPPPEQHEQRQQHAAHTYEELLQQGVPVTLDRLRRASGLRIHEVREFLAARGMTWEAQQERERKARLEAAYTRWMEQEQQPPTIEQLAKAAQTSGPYARRFLAERGMIWEARQEQERAERLKAAYTHLVEQEDPFGVTLLAKTAHVSPKYARRFLEEKQSQEKAPERTFFWDGSDDCSHCLCNLPHTLEEHTQELEGVLYELQERREDLRGTFVTHDLWEEPEEERDEPIEPIQQHHLENRKRG